MEIILCERPPSSNPESASPPPAGATACPTSRRPPSWSRGRRWALDRSVQLPWGRAGVPEAGTLLGTPPSFPPPKMSCSK